MSKEPVVGWARDEATYGLLNLLWKMKIVTAFVDARPLTFTFANNEFKVNNLSIVK